MPLTAKGEKILSAMEREYGGAKKGEQVFYASKNAGKISGVDSAKDSGDAFASKLDALADSVGELRGHAHLLRVRGDDVFTGAEAIAAALKLPAIVGK